VRILFKKISRIDFSLPQKENGPVNLETTGNNGPFQFKAMIPTVFAKL
jgi:hypothetical protein